MPNRPSNKIPWNNWYHCVGTTYGAWLRGDGRGWRSRHHREHVDGDYKNPPPAGKYSRLLRYTKFIMKRDAVILDEAQRRAAAEKIAEALAYHNVQFVDLCVSPTHFHVLCRFEPISPGIAIPGLKLNPGATRIRTPRHLIGIAKKESARHLSKLGLLRPGGAWAVRCKCKPVRDRRHQLRVTRYIRAHVKRGAIVWSIHLKPREK
jgi:REP element-mobilizing transposase RayT